MALARLLPAYFLAVLVAALLVSIANTHLGLQALAGIGAEITTSVRLDAIQRDLVGFAPTLLLLLALGFAIAFPVSGRVARLLGPAWRRFGYTIGGAVTVIILFNAVTVFYSTVMDTTITPIATVREWPGLLTLSIGGAAGGFLYALLTPPSRA